MGLACIWAIFRVSPMLVHARSAPRILMAQRAGEVWRLREQVRMWHENLGRDGKSRPLSLLQPGATIVLADIQEAGAIQHIWMTTYPTHWRRLILRAYWDGEEQPSIECPFGDFFANGWCERSNVNSLPDSGQSGRWDELLLGDAISPTCSSDY